MYSFTASIDRSLSCPQKNKAMRSYTRTRSRH